MDSTDFLILSLQNCSKFDFVSQNRVKCAVFTKKNEDLSDLFLNTNRFYYLCAQKVSLCCKR